MEAQIAGIISRNLASELRAREAEVRAQAAEARALAAEARALAAEVRAQAAQVQEAQLAQVGVHLEAIYGLAREIDTNGNIRMGGLNAAGRQGRISIARVIMNIVAEVTDIED